MSEPGTELTESASRMAESAPAEPNTEYRVFRVTRLASSMRSSGPCTLRPPFAEYLTEEQEAKVEAVQATVEGLVYSFATVGISRDIPMTESEAADLRARGWGVSSGRLPRGSEQAIVAPFIRRHQESLIRAEAALEARRQRHAREKREWRITTSTLYLPRVRRKVPWDPFPKEWIDLKRVYERRREGLDLCKMQRIVCGWERHPQAEIDHQDRFNPEVCKHLSEFPDSPYGILGLLEVFEPLAKKLQEPVQLLDQALIHWILDEDERETLYRIFHRGKELEAELADARKALERLSWKIDEEGQLRSIPGKMGGVSAEYLNRVIGELYRYLHPLYVRAFGDATKNPEALRRQVREILLPFFDPADLETDRGDQIWRAMNNVIYR